MTECCIMWSTMYLNTGLSHIWQAYGFILHSTGDKGHQHFWLLTSLAYYFRILDTNRASSGSNDMFDIPICRNFQCNIAHSQIYPGQNDHKSLEDEISTCRCQTECFTVMQVFGMKLSEYQPDFTRAFEHFCIHTVCHILSWPAKYAMLSWVVLMTEVSAYKAAAKRLFFHLSSFGQSLSHTVCASYIKALSMIECLASAAEHKRF